MEPARGYFNCASLPVWNIHDLIVGAINCPYFLVLKTVNALCSYSLAVHGQVFETAISAATSAEVVYL